MRESIKYQYLLRFSFLGFRLQGWQQQPGAKSVEGMIRKTLGFVLPGRQVKLLGAGRTDARVSASDYAAQLIIYGNPLGELSLFVEAMNQNLPPDIALSSAVPVSQDFNVIRDCRQKTYRYFFAVGEKPHPFCAPFLGYFPGFPDIGRMKKAARAFEGVHNFKSFIARPGPSSRLVREVSSCRLCLNEVLKASFFPERTYYLEVTATGFGRNQVRLMVAALVALGRGELSEATLEQALSTGAPTGIKQIAPASGLQLSEVQFTMPS
jgi:tRNA pseudouridine38-40 synthase